MRVTQNTLYNNIRGQLQTNSQRLLAAQEQVATQKKINRLSDNPVDAGRVLDLRGAIGRGSQYTSAIERVNSLAGTYDTVLDQAQQLVVRAKELLLQENNEASSTAATREAARVELATITSQLVQLGNTRFDGQSIFSGFQTDTPAFTDAAVAAAPSGPQAGTGAVTGQSISDFTALTLHNYEIRFSATVAGEFDVIDTTTGTAVLAGQSYTSGQPIVFEGIEITITDTPGAPGLGDVFAVNVTGPGAYQGDGQVRQIEVQEGTRVNQNMTGDVVFSGAGGGTDIFDTLNQINLALEGNDRAAMSALLDDIDAAQQQITTQRASVGAKVNLLETIKQRHEEIALGMDILRSNLEDVDVAEAITALNQQQNTYDATLGAAARVIQPSLLDFLR